MVLWGLRPVGSKGLPTLEDGSLEYQEAQLGLVPPTRSRNTNLFTAAIQLRLW